MVELADAPDSKSGGCKARVGSTPTAGILLNMGKVLIIITLLLSLVTLGSRLYGVDFSPWEIDELLGRQAPEFTLTDLSGSPVALSEFRGREVLLSFWASWCLYCVEESRLLGRLAERYRDLKIIIVTVDSSSETARDYLSGMPDNITVLVDKGAEVTKLYRVFALPTSFLISRDGVVKDVIMGPGNRSGRFSKELLKQ